MAIGKNDGVAPAPLEPVVFEQKDSLGLFESDYTHASLSLGCSVAAIKAAAEVESGGRGLLPDGRPVILFEAHVFDRLTGGKFRGSKDRYGVVLSTAKWDRSLYGATGVHQYERMEDAAKLDPRAAPMACSWGLFQVLGTNFASLGFPDTDSMAEFISDMDTPQEHLDMFVRFVMVNGLDDELRARDWKGFARGYNGPQYAANAYDTKLAAAYARHGGV